LRWQYRRGRIAFEKALCGRCGGMVVGRKTGALIELPVKLEGFQSSLKASRDVAQWRY